MYNGLLSANLKEFQDESIGIQLLRRWIDIGERASFHFLMFCSMVT